MSKKDFIKLADMIEEHKRNEKQYFSTDQLETLADFCQSQNPNFNRQRWFDYIDGKCGPNGGKI